MEADPNLWLDKWKQPAQHRIMLELVSRQSLCCHFEEALGLQPSVRQLRCTCCLVVGSLLLRDGEMCHNHHHQHQRLVLLHLAAL
jgi:hypothetical protein